MQPMLLPIAPTTAPSCAAPDLTKRVTKTEYHCFARGVCGWVGVGENADILWRGNLVKNDGDIIITNLAIILQVSFLVKVLKGPEKLDNHELVV